LIERYVQREGSDPEDVTIYNLVFPLPAGLGFDPMTGTISGIPMMQGSFSFTVTVTGFGGCAGSQDYTLTIP